MREALSVLPQVGLVHRDVQERNILQVSKEQFLLIYLETVAESAFQVPEGFGHFNEWSYDSLEDSLYMPMSVLYHLWDTECLIILRFQHLLRSLSTGFNVRRALQL
jgi:hypothetical protein